jgi:hypothetical protein
MSTMLPPEERATFLSWVREGAAQPTYDLTICESVGAAWRA